MKTTIFAFIPTRASPVGALPPQVLAAAGSPVPQRAVPSHLSTSDPSTSHSTQDPQAPPPGVDDSDGRGRILDGHGRGERNRHRRLADRLQTRRQSPHGDTTSLLALPPLSLSPYPSPLGFSLLISLHLPAEVA
jgi:hypothetical protein